MIESRNAKIPQEKTVFLFVVVVVFFTFFLTLPEAGSFEMRESSPSLSVHTFSLQR